jgi:hypothetical protein
MGKLTDAFFKEPPQNDTYEIVVNGLKPIADLWFSKFNEWDTKEITSFLTHPVTLTQLVHFIEVIIGKQKSMDPDLAVDIIIISLRETFKSVYINHNIFFDNFSYPIVEFIKPKYRNDDVLFGPRMSASTYLDSVRNPKYSGKYLFWFENCPKNFKTKYGYYQSK